MSTYPPTILLAMHVSLRNSCIDGGWEVDNAVFFRRYRASVGEGKPGAVMSASVVVLLSFIS